MNATSRAENAPTHRQGDINIATGKGFMVFTRRDEAAISSVITGRCRRVDNCGGPLGPDPAAQGRVEPRRAKRFCETQALGLDPRDHA